MQIVAIILLILFIGFLFWNRKKQKPVVLLPAEPLRKILETKVIFYSGLDEAGKAIFEKRVQDFLARVRITGIKTTVTDEDKVFVAASAIIPIFAFKSWEYLNLHEVLLYPSSFSEKYELQEGTERPVLGMVGNGALQQVMILSQPALRDGFNNHTDHNNTGIHEFVHLIDKTDGAVDGIPENILSNQYMLPWIDMMHRTIKEISAGKSDINPYGATNQAEFFAVVSEYFFERPNQLKVKHPELYQLLEKTFMHS